MTGPPDVVSLLTRDVEGLTGGKLAVETDPVGAVDGICGAGEGAEVLMPCRLKGDSLWVCVRCLPGLIHG